MQIWKRVSLTSVSLALLTRCPWESKSTQTHTHVVHLCWDLKLDQPAKNLARADALQIKFKGPPQTYVKPYMALCILFIASWWVVGMSHPTQAPTWSWSGAGGGAVVQFWRAAIPTHNKHPERLFFRVQWLRIFFRRLLLMGTLVSNLQSSTTWVQL